jgi:DNA-binding CsgD family transcriptional regulator
MNKRITKVVGGAAVIGALALAALSGTGTASAQSLIAKVGITKPAHDGRGPAKSMTAVAGVLKLTEAELKTQLDSGKSLSAVAATQNVSVQSVIDVIVADKQAHIAEEVASGEITQVQADAKLAEVTARIIEKVNSVRSEGMGGKGRGPAKSMASVAGVLKLTEVELKAQLVGGKSLAEVAATQNVSVQSVVDVIVAEKRTHIAEEVASGEMTQVQADAKLVEVTARATDMVNGVRPAGIGEGKHGGKGHGGRGGRTGRGHHGVEDGNA